MIIDIKRFEWFVYFLKHSVVLHFYCLLIWLIVFWHYVLQFQFTQLEFVCCYFISFLIIIRFVSNFWRAVPFQRGKRSSRIIDQIGRCFKKDLINWNIYNLISYRWLFTKPISYLNNHASTQKSKRNRQRDTKGYFNLSMKMQQALNWFELIEIGYQILFAHERLSNRRPT